MTCPRRLLRFTLVAGAVLLACACKGSAPAPTTRPSDPAAPTTPVTPTTPTPPAGQVFQIALPAARGDTADDGLVLWPFGVHGADHSLDGHPGWDIGYRIGSPVRAAAAGTVLSVTPDGSGLGSHAVQIDHRLPSGNYRTDYIHVTSVPAGIVAGASVTAGQEIGIAVTQTRMIGSQMITYAVIHFQVDDFSSVSGTTNVNAIDPESRLSADSREFFAEIWRVAAYAQELTEPFPANPRDVSFPIRRTWTRESGGLAAQIVFVRPDIQAPGYDFEFRDAAGALVERGAVSLDQLARPVSTIDFTTGGTGAVRRGVYDVESDTLRLDIASAGAPRPMSLGAASVYRTAR